MADWKTGPNAALGIPAFNLKAVDTVAAVKPGTIVKAFHDTYGEGEFIYLPGVASDAAGTCVVYDLNPAGPAVVRTLSGTHLNTGYGVAFSLVAVPALSYGWFQISGYVVALGIAGGAAGKCFLTTTAGAVDDTAIAGCQVLNARCSTAIDIPAVGFIGVTCNRPFIQGQIT